MKSCIEDWTFQDKKSVYGFLLKESFLFEGQDNRGEILSRVKVHTSSDFSYSSTFMEYPKYPRETL